MNFFKNFMIAAIVFGGQNLLFASEIKDDAAHHPHAIEFHIENQYYDEDTYLAIKFELLKDPEYIIELKAKDKFQSYMSMIEPANDSPITSLCLLLYRNFQDAFDSEKTVLKQHYANFNPSVKKIYAYIPAHGRYDFELDYSYGLSVTVTSQD